MTTTTPDSMLPGVVVYGGDGYRTRPAKIGSLACHHDRPRLHEGNKAARRICLANSRNL